MLNVIRAHIEETLLVYVHFVASDTVCKTSFAGRQISILISFTALMDGLLGDVWAECVSRIQYGGQNYLMV